MDQIKRKVYLYGIASARDTYRVVGYSFINTEKENLTISNLRTKAAWMKYKNPCIDHVYAIDDRGGLLWDYKNTVRQNSVESNVIFKCMLEEDGLLIM